MDVDDLLVYHSRRHFRDLEWAVVRRQPPAYDKRASGDDDDVDAVAVEPHLHLLLQKKNHEKYRRKNGLASIKVLKRIFCSVLTIGRRML